MGRSRFLVWSSFWWLYDCSIEMISACNGHTWVRAQRICDCKISRNQTQTRRISPRWVEFVKSFNFKISQIYNFALRTSVNWFLSFSGNLNVYEKLLISHSIRAVKWPNWLDCDSGCNLLFMWEFKVDESNEIANSFRIHKRNEKNKRPEMKRNYHYPFNMSVWFLLSQILCFCFAADLT